MKTLTYIGNTVIIDGRDIQIETELPSDIEAVQFHKGRDYFLEEPLMTKVPLEKYQYAIDEFNAAKELIDNKTNVEPTQDEKIKSIKRSIQDHLDSTALDLGFDNINSISKFLSLHDSIFYSDAMKLNEWQDSVWTYAEPELDKAIRGERTIPTIDEALDEIPKFVR